MKYASKSIASKWRKTGWMLGDSSLRPFVPETRLFGRASLEAMLSRYAVVYFKPSRGTGGKKISRIERIKAGSYRLKGTGGNRSGLSADELYARLKSLAGGKQYLLQRGIDLAHTGGKPFDLRVMVQKDGSQWVTTALFAKIGKKGRVVTNYHSGGKVAGFKKTMKGAGYSESSAGEAQRKLGQIGEATGQCFDRHRDGFREIGLDVAVDKAGRYWVLEANTRPQYYPLKSVDRSAYRRIIDYAKKYGRVKGRRK
ncbi:YheC/YheD family protein [Cohnella sp. LGH]|uniref:YheC/YheD family protein n=1 Tax=Cohnella sp. LGH TaxID=1619153 RepID=UPI001AD98DBC|nr:YheC/YheD family protein [Cohnella sp. LGH]QTH45933.1 YheC/YheD family protein [Cohnella sp. LGH]